MWLIRPSSAAEWTSLISGCVVFTLGVVLMLAWQFEASALLRLGGSGAMVRFNTCVTLALSGLVIVASSQQKRRVAVGLALLVIAIALAHAIAWHFRYGNGLESLLHRPSEAFILANGSGRFSISASICFILFGIAMIDRQSSRPHPAITSLFGYCILLLTLVALYRSVMGTDHTIGWRLTTGIALAASLGIFLLGISTVSLAIVSSKEGESSPWLVAYPAAFTLATASLIIWLELKQMQSVDLRRDTIASAANLRLRIHERIMDRIYAIEDLSRQWPLLSSSQRSSDVEALLRRYGSLKAIVWVDADFQPASQGSGNGVDATAGALFPSDRLRELTAKSEMVRSFRFLPETEGAGNDMLIVGFVPTFDAANQRTGFNTVAFHFDPLFNFLSRHNRRQRFSFAVNDGDRQLYRSATDIPRGATVDSIDFKLRGLKWRIDVWPTAATIAAHGNNLPDIALAHGLFGAALLGSAIQWRQRAARRTAEAERSAAAWRESEERFELAVSASNDGIWDWREAGPTYYASRRYREILGYALDDDLLLAAEFIESLHPEDRPKVQEAIRTHLRDGTVYEVTCRFYKSSGEMIWLLVRGNSIWSGEGKHVRMAGSIADITKKLEAEHQLLAQVDAIAATNQALTEMAGAARAAAEAKSSFLRNMSHELRTPLNSIIGFSSGLLRHAEPHPLNEHQRDRLHRIAASGQHLLELVNNVLDIAKTEASQTKLYVEEFSLVDLFDEVTAIAEVLLQTNRLVRLHASIDANVPTPWLDQTKLKQILLNLLSNAAKFTDEGSITLAASFDGIHWRFNVSDTGIGISLEDQERIFDYFEQLETNGRSTEGTGLGLSICELLAHTMGGAISVESQPGVGSTFTLVVPQTPVDADDVAPVQQADPSEATSIV